MPTTEIKERIIAHYKESNEPLLLSKFGKALRVEGVWPRENETRSLRAVIESMRPEVDVIRDETALAYAIVVAKGYEHIAHNAISMRKNDSFLQNLPKSVLLAFLAKTTQAEDVYLQTKPPFKYDISDEFSDSGSALVDKSFRIEAEYIDTVYDLPVDKRELLANNIREWASKHNLSLDIFYRRRGILASIIETTRRPTSINQPPPAPEKKNALERLQAAQPPGIAERMVIPLDIALLLSRHP